MMHTHANVLANKMHIRHSLHMQSQQAFSATLEVLTDPFPAHEAPTIPPPPTESDLQPEADALLAIYRLRSACEQMIESPNPITGAECRSFVAYARDRLQVILNCVPGMVR